MKIFKISNNTYEAIIPKLEDGNCFHNVIEWLTSNDSDDAVIVHGKVTNFKNDRIDHAWIERGSDVIDPTVGVRIDKIKYYAATQAGADAKYSSEQAMINAVRIGNGGPWTKQEVAHRYLFRVD